MIPRRVVLENFLSFGTPAVEIAFTADEPLWVIRGPNGIGKSAVFDAITYCLFGQHRGGMQGVDQLVRHGANGFCVTFEFSFGGRDYRILRSRQNRKSVERLFDLTEDPPVEIDVATIAQWVKDRLGLTFDQFTASVLLLQGKADQMVTGGGAARLELLRRIINMEQYECLSERVKSGTQQAAEKRKFTTSQLLAMPDVPQADRDAAQLAADTATTAYTAAVADQLAANTRVEQARRHEQLVEQLAVHDARLTAAAERERSAATIIARRDRLRLLETAVPNLAKLVAARQTADELRPKREQYDQQVSDLEAKNRTLTADLVSSRYAMEDHRRLGADAASAVREAKHHLSAATDELETSEKVSDIDVKLSAYPADLDDQSISAINDRTTSQQIAAVADQVTAKADAIRERSEADLAAFDTVEVGAKCPRCLQDIGPEYAAGVRAEIAARVERDRQSARSAHAAADAARSRHIVASDLANQLAAQIVERNNLLNLRLGLTRGGVISSVTQVRQQISDLESELIRLQTVVADEAAKQQAAKDQAEKLTVELDQGERDLTSLRRDRDTVTARLTQAEATIDALSNTIPPDFAAVSTASEVAVLQTELTDLSASGVAVEAQKLDEDRVRRDEWRQQRDQVAEEIAALPESVRVPVPVAETAAADTAQRTNAAEADRDATRRKLDELSRQADEHARRLAEDRQAEIHHRVGERLDKLLGSAGLQRDLVRSAEREIVRYADETVRLLSDGDLSLQLVDDSDGKDKAFTLTARRSDDPQLIGVTYLSGSQKFRVAVAVALGIGRFAAASTGSTPLESVIIDEGFGSLDRDGLRCMGDELTRLKDRCDLKRIVLVSHQEEFADRFPVGWRLTAAESGTVATPYSNR